MMKDKSMKTVIIRKEPETVLVDGMGNFHNGYYCDGCNGACPYCVYDTQGNSACYEDTYFDCEFNNNH